MKKNKHHYSPIDELNAENEAALINPFKVLILCTFLVPACIALIIHYKVAIDTFAIKYPLLCGLSLIGLSVTGLVVMVKKMLW